MGHIHRWQSDALNSFVHLLDHPRISTPLLLLTGWGWFQWDALDACKYVIDELKATVPIWKKEVLANGEVWKENSEFLERRLELGKKDGDWEKG